MMKMNNRYPIGILASAAILASASAGGDALAQVVATANYCIPAGTAQQGGFQTTDVGDTLVSNGLAKVLPDGRFQLTDASSLNGQASTIYYNQPLSFRYTDEVAKIPRQFHAFFSFSMGPTPLEVNAGSGLAFLVQNNAESSSVGSNGDGMGYGGLKKSFAFEFDTHPDIPSMGTVNYQDPLEDHIGFMLDGNQSEHVAYYKPLDANQGQIEFNSVGADLKRFYVWIDYEGGTGPDAKKYKLYFSETKAKPAASIVWEEHLDFMGADPANPNFPESGFDPDYWLSTQAAGQPGQGWVGFSAATYGAEITNDHFIHEFEFSNNGIPCACQGDVACDTTVGKVACSAGPLTQGAGVCVECTEANPKPCTGNTPVCDKVNEVCVECNTNAECITVDNPHCDAIGHTCVLCATDTDCSPFPATPACANAGTPTATCVECNDDTDCTGSPATPVCADAGTPTAVCVQCNDNTDCTGSPDTPVCANVTHTCEGCETNADCPSDAPVCDPATKTCAPCATDADCSDYLMTPVCELTGPLAGQCVPKPGNTDVIEGGSCAVEGAGSSTGEGIFAGLMAALGAAATMARRRRRNP